MKDHRGPLVVRQRFHRLTDQARAIALHQLLLGAGAGIDEAFENGTAFVVGIACSRNFVTAIADRVERQNRRDTIKPGGEPRVRLIALARFVDAKENLLGEVFSLRLVANHAPKVADEWKTIPAQEY